MSHSRALDGVDSVLLIIKKGNTDAAKKIEAILPLLEGLRNDIQDLAEEAYSNYVPDLPPPTFDVDEAVGILYAQLSKQSYNNLYAHYTADILSDEKDPYMRVAFCRALVKFAQAQKRDPSPVWISLIEQDGIFPEAAE